MKIEVEEAVQRRLKRLLQDAGAREIGGVLMAEQLDVGHFRIVDFSVDEQTGSVAHFVRSPEHHEAALAKFFARTGNDFRRFNYLGEWHSHPSFSVLPSSEDQAAMVSLVEGERGISFAVLMIVRLGARRLLECSISLFVRGGSSPQLGANENR